MGSVKSLLFPEGIILSLMLSRLLHQDSKLLALCWSHCTTCIVLVAFYQLKRGNEDVASCTQSLTRRMREHNSSDLSCSKFRVATVWLLKSRSLLHCCKECCKL